VTLTGFLGGQSAAVEDIASSGVWSLGLGVVAPIFDAGRREAVEDQAAARYRQTLASWQKSVEGAFREVSDALVNFEETSNSEADLLERVKAARQALDLSQIRYESGYSPYLEVLDAQRTANDAEIAFVRNRQARLAFSVDLMRALGGGWNSGSEPEFKER
jgi:multidrug efflux system outer membrane protein